MNEAPENNTEQLCDLCRLPIDPPGYKLQSSEGLKHFCCEGCMGVYSMLHPDQNPPASGSPK